MNNNKDVTKINIKPLTDEEYEAIIAVHNNTLIIKGRNSNLFPLHRKVKHKANNFKVVEETIQDNIYNMLKHKITNKYIAKKSQISSLIKNYHLRYNHMKRDKLHFAVRFTSFICLFFL